MEALRKSIEEIIVSENRKGFILVLTLWPNWGERERAPHMLVECANYPFTHHNFELASFPGFPLLLSRESLARPMETSSDQ